VNRQVSFHKLPEKEINEAAEYYEKARPLLGSEFLAEIRRCVQCIVDYPEAGPALARSSIRRWLARRFPYAVIYSVRPEKIRVLAVMHLKRRPMYWLGRR
jgi:toxin ParE1/3/4